MAPKSPVSARPPVLSPQHVSVSQNLILAAAAAPSATGPAAGQVISGANLLPGTMIAAGNQLGMQQLQLHPNGTLMSTGGGQVFQIQFPPSVSVQGMVSTAASKSQPLNQPISASNKVKQPQLLPKPSSNASQSQPVGAVGSSGGGGGSGTIIGGSGTVIGGSGTVIGGSGTVIGGSGTVIGGSGTVIGGMGSSGAMRVSSNVVTAAPAPSSVQQPIFINQGGLISSVQPAAAAGPTAGQIIMGQMVAPSGQAQAAPVIIQQPGSGQMFVLRPNTPSIQTAPTIVPIAAQPGQLTGQLILQQGQTRGIIGNQQVKLMPQSQMQMQQIQTPTGSKLIAMPIGQTLMAAPAGANVIAAPASTGGVQFAQGLTPAANAAGQIQFQTAPMSVVSSQPGFAFQTNPTTTQTIVTSLPVAGIRTTSVVQLSPPTIITSSVQATQSHPLSSNPNSVIQLVKPEPPASALSPTKKKKSKKKKRDHEDEAPGLLAPPPSKSGTVDLGALMKDVGLDLDDLDSFNMDGSTGLEGSVGGGNEVFSNMPLTLNTSHDSSSTEAQPLISSLSYANPGELAQHSQPIMSQVSSGLGQMISHTSRAPEGFVVSQPKPSMPATVVQPQAAAVTMMPPAAAVAQGVGVRMTGPAQQMLTPSLNAGSSFQLIQGPDGQFILQTQPAATTAAASAVPPPTTTLPEQTPPTTVSVADSRTSSSSSVTPPRASPRTPARARQPADPTRKMNLSC